jgi:hypothetical protein
MIYLNYQCLLYINDKYIKEGKVCRHDDVKSEIKGWTDSSSHTSPSTLIKQYTNYSNKPIQAITICQLWGN